jgi:hypothetical protein
MLPAIQSFVQSGKQPFYRCYLVETYEAAFKPGLDLVRASFGAHFKALQVNMNVHVLDCKGMICGIWHHKTGKWSS